MPANTLPARIWPCLLLLWLGMGTDVTALTNRLFTAHGWYSDNGLPHSTVQTVCQTSDGFLWVGTVDGLCRFDGVEFKSLPLEGHGNPRTRWINAMRVARDGGFWIGTGAGQLYRVQGERVKQYEHPALAGNSILSLCEDQSGTLWMGTRSGLMFWRDGKISPLTGSNHVAGSAIRALAEGKKGEMWVGTSSVLVRLQDGRETAFYNDKNGLSSAPVRSLCRARDGSVWVGTSGGVYQMVGENFPRHFTKLDGLPDNLVSAIHEDRRGNLWIGTFGGLARVVDGKIKVEVNPEGDAYDQIACFFEDREGNLWAGAKDGLYRLNPQPFDAITTQNGLAHNNVISVLEDRLGGLWVGTWGGGLQFFKNGTSTNFTMASTKMFRNDLILAMYQANDQSLWVGTDFDGGLYRYLNGKFTRYGSDQGLPSSAIRVIREDSEGKLWVGTTYGLYHLQKNKFIRHLAKEGLPHEIIRCLAMDVDNNFWVGTEGGLAVRKEKRFEAVTNGFSDSVILSLYADPEGGLWVGTARGGLNYYYKGKVTVFNQDNGLFDKTVLEIVPDDRGRFWMSSYRGVFFVNRSELADVIEGKAQRVHCTAFDKDDGMVSSVCVGAAKPSGWKARDGRIWFPTTKGLVVTDSMMPLEKNEVIPEVVVEGLRVDRKDFVPGAGRPGKAGAPPEDAGTTNFVFRYPAEVELPPGRGELEIHYAALSYRDPAKNRYRFRLGGVDEDWVEAGARNVAYYNNLQPGTYSFQVQGANNDGVWNTAGAGLRFTLHPQYWQTWWFQLLVGLAAGGVLTGLYLVVRFRRNSLERLRIRIAADLHDEVGSSISSISLLTRKIHRSGELSGGQQEDLGAINRIAASTSASIRDIVWFINPEYDTVQDLVLRMKDVASIQLGGLDLEVRGPQEQLARRLSLDFRRNLFLMFKEMLGNIAKHSQATAVQVEIAVEKGRWRLVIRDNGVGFDLATARRGNGLKNLQQRAERLRGELKVESAPGKGTSLIFQTRHF